MAESKLITDPMKLRLIASPHAPENKLILLDTDPGFSNLDLPVRSELAVLSADKPSDKVMGWSITETVGIGVVNARGVSRLIMDGLPLVYEWPLPGRAPHSIKIFYEKMLEDEPGLSIQVCLYLKKPKVISVATYVRYGFKDTRVGKVQTRWDQLPGKTDAERLCGRLCTKEVMSIPGPNMATLLADPLWQIIIDELPAALLTAEVMLS